MNYTGNYIYKNGKLSFILTDKGRIVPDSSGFEYEYFIKDHLGNTRLVVKDSSSAAAVMSEAHYYPFGMQINALSYTNPLQRVSNEYLYNGKELQEDFGLGRYDYGKRFYDAEVPRFTSIDRFAEKYSFMSPYQYAANNPVNFIDVNGDWIKMKIKRSARKELKKQGTSGSDYIKKLFADEYGLDVSIEKRGRGFKVSSNAKGSAAIYDSEKGISKTSGLKVSNSARTAWNKQLSTKRKSKGKIVFKSGQGSNAGYFGAYARVHLNEMDNLTFDNVPIRTFNIARIMEHEYLAHVINNLKDQTKNNTDPGEAATHVNYYRTQMELPERLNYGSKTVDKTTQTTEYRINFSNGGTIREIVPISRIDKLN